MRLYELAYCCRIVGALGAFDRATIEMRDATGDFVDPANADHHAPLFSWLRRWGCRQFAKDDELTSSESLTTWWNEWADRLPAVDRTLDELGDEELATIAAAYEDLRMRQAAWQRRKSGDVQRSFGPAGAAKALYAIRPNCCSPWDEPIREYYGYDETGDGYLAHLQRIRTELAEAVEDLGPGADASQLPDLVGRPVSSPVKLSDEHDWVRRTRGIEPPSPETLVQWARWANPEMEQDPPR